MRLPLLSGLLFALALAFQAMTPVAANVAMGRGPGRSVELCLQAATKAAAARTRLLGRDDSRGDECAMCAVCCSGVAPLEARPNSVGSAPVQWTALAWTVADCALPALRHDHARQARAPPRFS